MKAKCIKCGDTVEVTKPREYKSCKCGAIALDYGDPPYYYRTVGSPEDFDGEIEDAPKLRERAIDVIGEENIGGESKPMGNIVIEPFRPELMTTCHEPAIISRAAVIDSFWSEMAEHFKKLGKYSDLMVQKECFEALAKLCEEKSENS